MVQLYAFCRSLRMVSFPVVALALCSAAIVASATPASARSHHGAGRHAPPRHVSRHAGRHYAYRHRHYRHLVSVSRWDAGVAQMQARGLAGANASLASSSSAGGLATSGGFGSSNVVAEARRYLGGNPTGRGSLWCARFMNMVLQHSGYRGTGSDMARSFASYGQRVSGPQVGAIAVMGRRGGGHVGVVSGIDAGGNPIVVSGNNGNRVREAPISRGRIYAYVMPAS
ncbi:MAG TPA: TIGR02594 family protein [Bradyrhizobium sp.]